MIDRRRFLSMGLVLAAGATLFPQSLFAAPNKRTLSLFETHSEQSLTVDYWVDGWYNPDGLHQLNVLLRDWRTDEVTEIDRNLLDLVALLQQRVGGGAPVHIISGYRSPGTNSRLARRSSGVASNSYHMYGQAVDLRVPGRSLSGLRSAAIDLGVGGVGYYPRSDFVHVDTGPVRTW